MSLAKKTTMRAVSHLSSSFVVNNRYAAILAALDCYCIGRRNLISGLCRRSGFFVFRGTDENRQDSQ